jgi:hypothetical protein
MYSVFDLCEVLLFQPFLCGQKTPRRDDGTTTLILRAFLLFSLQGPYMIVIVSSSAICYAKLFGSLTSFFLEHARSFMLQARDPETDSREF